VQRHRHDRQLEPVTQVAASGPQSEFAYQPALDGVRAIAVVLVLLFHSGLPFLSGGYLGVSVFFTLSGYLITGLLLTEHDRAGHVSIGSFYTRRMRRLLPASTLCVVLIVIARGFGAFERVGGLRRDVFGALLYAFNWVKLAGGRSYSELFLGGTSPLEHYWSLAIEEQFYWLWPAVLLGVLRLVGRRRVGRAVASLFVVFSLAAVLIAMVFGSDAVYWATPARLPEILVGASLACFLSKRRRVSTHARWLAALSLSMIVALSMTLPAGSGLAYEGALPVLSLLSAMLIYSLQVPGLIRTVMASRPLVAVGRISYGLYLFHWPVFVLLREHQLDLTKPDRLAVALSITAAITVVSYRLVELPIRHSIVSPVVTMRWAVLSTAVALVGGALLVPTQSAFSAQAALAEKVGIVPADSLKPFSSALPITGVSANETSLLLGAPPARPVRILLLGDSTMNSLTVGLEKWASTHPTYAQVTGRWAPGLVFLLDGEIADERLRGFADVSRPVLDDVLINQIPALRPDVVVLWALRISRWGELVEE